MSEKFKFYNKEDLYFISFTVINWIDVFTRNAYRDVLLESWQYCIKEKGLVVHAWCIMTNHVHMIISSKGEELSHIMRDMKSYTSTTIRKLIVESTEESRKEWMLLMMKQKGIQNNNNKDFQFWQQHNHPVLLDSNYLMDQKLDYIHNNPVKAGFVDEPEGYLYSSARDYSGKKGLLAIELIE